MPVLRSREIAAGIAGICVLFAGIGGLLGADTALACSEPATCHESDASAASSSWRAAVASVASISWRAEEHRSSAPCCPDGCDRCMLPCCSALAWAKVAPAGPPVIEDVPIADIVSPANVPLYSRLDARDLDRPPRA